MVVAVEWNYSLKGTCSGLIEALDKIPESERFMLIWCDLILPKDFELPNVDENFIGISKDFSCRWSYRENEFVEEKSSEHGVAGLFVFQNKQLLENIPASGEFVKWLQSQNIKFEEIPLHGTKEYGLYSEWTKLPRMRCRPFNRIEVKDDRVYKFGIDDQGKKLAVREVAWYKNIQGMEFKNIPTIYDYDPLCMEFIDGKNIYEYSYIPDDRKIRELVPFAKNETIVINGKKCRNIFFHRDEVEKFFIQQLRSIQFETIHVRNFR